MDKHIFVWIFIILFIISSSLLLYQQYDAFQTTAVDTTAVDTTSVDTTPVDASKTYYKTTDADVNDMNTYNVLKDTLYKDISATNVPFEGGFDSSNNYVAGTPTQPPVYGQCSTLSSCSSCLATPDCFWCDTQKVCVANNAVYTTCANEKVFDSLLQCNLNATINDKSDTNINYTGESIIPIIGLSRNSDGTFTKASLKIIMDSLKARGYTTSDVESKKATLDIITKEEDTYNTLYKNSMSAYVANGIDYEIDDKSLQKAKNIKSHIDDLKDISRYINLQGIETFLEGFQQTFDVIQSDNDIVVSKNNTIKRTLQIIWVANLVALGTIIIM